MVGIHLVKNLRTETQNACFNKVMAMVHSIGFNAVGVCVDNAPANCKFYKDFLSNGTMQDWIINKYTGGKIF